MTLTSRAVLILYITRFDFFILAVVGVAVD